METMVVVLILNFNNMKKQKKGMFNVFEQIKQETSVEFLKQLLQFIDMDIESIGKDSDIMKKMKSEMRNKPIEEVEKDELRGFNDLKSKVNERLQELTK